MSPIAKTSIVVGALVAVLMVATPSSAQTISAQVAKECRAAAIKAHPPSPAGSGVAYAQAQREYFRNCVSQRAGSK